MAPSTRSSASSPAKRVLYEEDQDGEETEQFIPSTPRKRARRTTRDAVVPVTPAPAPAIQSAGISVKNEEGSAGASHMGSTTGVDDSAQIIVRPKLSFNYQAAKAHLIRADPRFAEMFETLPCKPFEEETDLNPFRALCCSILGQQASLIHPFASLGLANIVFNRYPGSLPVQSRTNSFDSLPSLIYLRSSIQPLACLPPFPHPPK